MSAYAANITNCDAYWFKRRCELESTIEQECDGTVFFTFSYADNHLHDLHRLMPGNAAATAAEKRAYVAKNPHLVDWYFSFRLDEFLKAFFDNLLDCKWRWHRCRIDLSK
jgi:hypothetical protein